MSCSRVSRGFVMGVSIVFAVGGLILALLPVIVMSEVCEPTDDQEKLLDGAKKTCEMDEGAIMGFVAILTWILTGVATFFLKDLPGTNEAGTTRVADSTAPPPISQPYPPNHGGVVVQKTRTLITEVREVINPDGTKTITTIKKLPNPDGYSTSLPKDRGDGDLR